MLASAARWSYLCCAIFLSGTLALLWTARRHVAAAASRWWMHCARAAILLAAMALLMALAAGALQALQVSDAALADHAALQRFFRETRSGHVWLARIALLTLTFALLIVWRVRLERAEARAGLALATLLALASLAAGGLGGHAAAFEPAWPAMAAQAMHLAAVGIWLGALPALAYLLYAHSQPSTQSVAAESLQQFSKRALLLMLVIIATGVPLADLQVETFPALLGTHYGVTLLWKLAFTAAVLAAAAHVRFVLLRRFAAGRPDARKLAHWILLELLLALAVVWWATELSRTVPARHDDVAWPFDFRYSIDATWTDRKLRERIIAGAVVVAVGALFAWVGVVQRMRARRWLPLCIILVIVGLAISLPASKIDAYPWTYRKSTVPYQAISVANGARLFAEHCVSCHGHAGHGDGARAASLPLRPADLTEAHTALHTAGDLFWWLTHGKPPGVMPGFATTLGEDERWDLINFLRTLSAGYQARIIGERIVPKKPWLAAPDFSYVTAGGASGTLRDFRGKRAVVLIIGAGAALSERLGQLAAQPQYAMGAVLVASSDLAAHAALADSVIAEGNEEILATYRLLRRTLSNADVRDAAAAAPHIEFLIDRFGYVRARWLPSENERGWGDLSVLRAQIAALEQEPQVRPPPEEHVH